jgi:hypothetical protein
MKSNELMTQCTHNMEVWFNQVMENATSRYKHDAQRWAFLIGVLLALVFNVDTLNITEQLWREPTVRAALVAQAANYKPAEGTKTFETDVANIQAALTIPVGWTTTRVDESACRQSFDIHNQFAIHIGGECKVINDLPAAIDLWGWFLKVLGIFISGLAASQGAPFWFDVLRKALSLRSSREDK